MAACRLCGRAMRPRYELPHIWHQPRDSGRYTVMWCRACDLGALVPQPDDHDLASFYGGRYFSSYGNIGSDRSALSLLDRARVHLAWRLDRSAVFTPETLRWWRSAPLRICDIGCGNGSLMQQLQAAGHSVVGVEPDESARARADAFGLEVYAGQAESLPLQLRPRSFDLVTMIHVLEHCRQPLSAVRNAARLLRPNGRLVIEVPNNGSLRARHAGGAWYHADAGRHLYFFTARSLGLLAARAGLHVVAIDFADYVTQFVDDRIAAERRLWKTLFDGEPAARPGWTFQGAGYGWWLLLRTALARPAERYSCVRMTAEAAT